MTSKLKFLAASSLVSIALMGANPAMAAGTTAGTSIKNDVTVSYSVGGVAQTDKQASDTFTVDRKINLSVVELDGVTTQVSPGQTAAVTAFTVTNTSNQTLDFAVAASQLVGGTAKHNGTDNFDVSNLQVFVDTNGNNIYDPGVDTATFIDELAADASRTVFILGDIANTRVTGDVAGVVLTATAREGGTIGTQGAVVTQTAGANTAGVDTVFADIAGKTDAARDGKFSSDDDYTVAAANLTVVKFSKIISDPFNNTTNPKAIPGAIIEYCIGVANATGSAPATNLNISDTLPTGITYLTSFGVKTNGTYTAASSTCSAGTGSGTFSGGTVSGTLNDVPGGGTNSLVFRATVNAGP